MPKSPLRLATYFSPHGSKVALPWLVATTTELAEAGPTGPRAPPELRSGKSKASTAAPTLDTDTKREVKSRGIRTVAPKRAEPSRSDRAGGSLTPRLQAHTESEPPEQHEGDKGDNSDHGSTESARDIAERHPTGD